MGGICMPREHPVIFLFTGESGRQYGYVDEWSEDCTYYKFAGRGQVGDMKMDGWNRAIRDHKSNGKALHLFTALGKGQPIRYEGEFEYLRQRIIRGADKHGVDREVLVFDLVPKAGITPTADPLELSAQLSRLRQKQWSTPPEGVDQPERGPSPSGAGRIKRSALITDYVLKAAGELCEFCSEPAPFLDRKFGRPFLEVHHVVQLAEGGPDQVWNAVALCPNCHRRLHHSVDADEARECLYRQVGRLRRPR